MASSSIPIPTASSGKAIARDGLDSRHLHSHGRYHRHRSHNQHLRAAQAAAAADAASAGSLSSSSMSPSSSAASSSSLSSSSIPTSPSRIPRGVKSMSKSVPAEPPTRAQQRMAHNRRPSLLSDAISKQEAHVINIGDPDGPPRLITYLASSQGFTWNPEIFVPSYIDCDYTPLEHRREPVVEIFLSDEEIDEMLPK